MFDLTVDDLRRWCSAKWRFKEPDVLPLWVAEMDVRLAEPTHDALVELVERSDTGYVTWDGLPEAYAAFAARRWQQELDPGRMFIVPDVMRGVFEVLVVATEPGDQVVVNPPVYAPFFETVTHARRRLVEVPLVRDADGMYELDLAALEQAFAGGARAYPALQPAQPGRPRVDIALSNSLWNMPTRLVQRCHDNCDGCSGSGPSHRSGRPTSHRCH